MDVTAQNSEESSNDFCFFIQDQSVMTFGSFVQEVVDIFGVLLSNVHGIIDLKVGNLDHLVFSVEIGLDQN